jgi:hypothetical protein
MLPHQFITTEFRHHAIQNNDTNSCNFESLGAIECARRCMAFFGKALAQKVSHSLFVLNDQQFHRVDAARSRALLDNAFKK